MVVDGNGAFFQINEIISERLKAKYGKLCTIYVTTGMSHKWAMQMGPTYYTWRTRGIGLRITGNAVPVWY